MNNIVRVNIVNEGFVKEYPAGILLIDILTDLYPDHYKKYITALINNRNVDFSYPVYFHSRVEFIDITNKIGYRAYRYSLAFVLYKALTDIYPEASLRIEHAISGGYLSFIKGVEADNETIAKAIKERMHEIINLDMPFIHHSAETEEVINLFKKTNRYDKISLLEERGDIYSSYYTLGNSINSFYNPLAPSTGYLEHFNLETYGNGFLITMPSSKNPKKITASTDQPQLFNVFTEFAGWNKTLKVNNISDINAKIKSNDIYDLIMIAEALQEKKVVEISEMIQKYGSTRIILISGPSSSGKTTFSKRLALQLVLAGLQPVNISLDDYYIDRELTPLDENGEYDFEHIEALNIPLLNEHLQALLNGKEVNLPKYDFKAGKSILNNKPTRLEDHQVLVLEGIHALNPRLTSQIAANVKFKIYISALTTLSVDDHNYISTSENRLIRRIVRDYNYRGISAEDNINRWESVRNGEDKWIYPFQEEADVMFNSSLLFELPVLKPFIEPMLKEVKPNNKAYVQARRLLNFFSYIRPINSQKIAPTSLLREFLGGSTFRY